MKKKATARPAKASSRQPTLNFPPSSEADLVAESAAAETSTKTGAKSRRKRTADDADKPNKAQCDSSAMSAQSAVKTKSRSEGQGINAERPSWSILPLSHLVHSIDQGWSPRCENYAASSHSEWAVIKTTAIQNLQFFDQENKELPSTLEPRKHLELRPGDLLITRAGPRNRVGVACLVRSTRPRLMLCDKAYRLKCRLDVVEPAFLELALNSPDLVSQVNKLKTGINDSGVNITQTPFMNLEIPVPPVVEQHRIVAEIEKQFTRLDAGVAALKRVQANLKRYRAAVLKAACEGKLVPTEADLARQQGRTYETGEQLLQRILAERRQNWQGRGQYKEPATLDANEHTPLPSGWTWTTVEQLLSEQLCNGISIKGSDQPPGVRALRLSAMSDSGFDFSDVRYLPLLESAVDDLWIKHGDFFMSRGNGSLHLVGRGTSAQQPQHPTIFPDTMIRLRLVNAVRDSGWVRTIWASRIVRSQIETKVKTTAGIYKISQPQVEGILIPLPPLAEQKRMVAEVERRLSVVQNLEAVLVADLRRSIHLRDSILKQAFMGEFS